MYNFNNCPLCKLEIEQERLQQNPVVCNNCGFTASVREVHIERKAKNFYTRTLLSISAFMAVGFVSVVYWDSYVIEALPLKAKQTLGMASSADLNRLIEICQDRGNLDCQKESLKQLSQWDKEALARLGKLYWLNGETLLAIKSLNKYFVDGGLNMEASYHYARALDADGQIDKASEHYETVLRGKPGIFQVTVTRNYVQMLVDHNRLSQARDVLKRVRKLGANTQDFMEPLFEELSRKASKL